MKSTPLDANQRQRVFGSSVLTHPALITVATGGGNGRGPEIGTASCIYNAERPRAISDGHTGHLQWPM